MTASFSDRVTQARGELDGGNPTAAYAALRGVFIEPDLHLRRNDMVAALQLLRAISDALADPEFAQIVQCAAAAPDDVAALYALGYECLEHQLRWPAACVLERALALGPATATIVAELVTALASDGRHALACKHLNAAHELAREHFDLRYLLAFNTLMSGDVQGATDRATALGSAVGPDQAAMKHRIEEMLARARAVARISTLDAHDLRGWHFVGSGGLLLHLSPLGADEGMNGRYAMTQDSAVRCRHGLLRVHAVLDEWDQVPQRVLLLPDQRSHVLGLAAAALYGVDAQPFEQGVPGLIVAYDLSTLHPSTPAAVAHHHADQVLFAHATCWTDPPPCAADLTTYLYEVNFAPGEELQAREPEPPACADPDDPATEVAVQAILNAIVDDDPDELASDTLTHVTEFAQAVRTRSSAEVSEGLRPPMWEGGPVQSSRFGGG